MRLYHYVWTSKNSYSDLTYMVIVWTILLQFEHMYLNSLKTFPRQVSYVSINKLNEN